MRKLIISCFICKRLQSLSYNYPENSNLPSYRINATASFQVCGLYYLGPLYIKDIYCKTSNDNMHKAYIVIFTCATSRSIILDLVEDSSSKNFRNSIARKIILQGEAVQRKLCQVMEQCLSRSTVSCFVLNGGSHGSSI